jgi:hypothetical protein
MSLIKAIKAQLGLSTTPANNFTLDASANNGTMKLARNSGQDIMTVAADGKVNFSVGVLGFQIVTEDVGGIGKQFGIKLPEWLGGVIINAGMRATVSYGVNVVETTGTYSIPFSNMNFATLVKRNFGVTAGEEADEVMTPQTVGTWSIYCFASNGPFQARVSWFAIGN